MSSRTQELESHLTSFHEGSSPTALRQILETFQGDSASAEELEYLRDEAGNIAAVGLGEDLVAAIQGAKTRHPLLVTQIETLAYMGVRPSEAAATLRSMHFHPALQGFDVINAVNRGDLDGAIRAAREQNWFVNDAYVPHALAYTVWALLFQERYDEAEDIAFAWAEAHRQTSPRAAYQMLHVDAILACARDDFASAVRLLEEAYAVASQNGFAVEALFEQARLAAGYAHAGQMDLAHEAISTWPELNTSSTLDAVRAIALAEIHVLGRNWEAAEAAIGFLLANRRRNPLYRTQALFLNTLCADDTTFASRLAEFAEMVTQFPNRRMLRRLAEIERLVQAGLTNPRTGQVLFVSRQRRTFHPIARIWYPLTIQKTGIYVDCVRKIMYLRGSGPFDPHVCPKRFDMLIALLKTPNMRLEVAHAFQLVWGMAYDASRHENKVHVTVHRLRKQLEQLADQEIATIRIRDGYLEVVPELDAYLLDFPSDYTMRVPTQTLEEQVLLALSGCVVVPPRELETLLNVHRSSLQVALRNLVDARLIEKVGRGRATCYRRSQCGVS